MSKVYKTCNPALQEKVRALVNDQTGTMTQAALAKEIGYSGASISTYISDKFENDVEKFEARLINYFEFKQKQESLEARASSLCPVDARAYVPLSISENIYQAIEYCRLVGGISVLHGSAGVGKTMAIQKYKRDNLGFVVHFRASERLKTPKQVAAAIADKVGVRNCRNEKEMYARNTAVIPAIAMTETFEVASEAEMLALEAQPGDVAVRSDVSKTFILKSAPATSAENWTLLKTPTDGVLSVNGKTGVVSLNTDDVSEGGTHKYFTNERAAESFRASVAETSVSALKDGGSVLMKTDTLILNGGNASG